MFEMNTTSSPPPAEPARWERTRSVETVAAFDATPAHQLSQRQFAQAQSVPRSTLQYWLARKDRLDAEPAVVAFFESPVGLAFLHRLVLAAQFVFTQAGAGGIRSVSQFLELSTLARFVAASYGAQQQVAQRMQAEISAYAAHEQPRLAQKMTPKKITVCEDETFHPEICLVAIEPVSNFILVEKYAAHRDAATWNQALEQALQGLPVEVIQSTSDEAQGLLAHVREGLGAHHAPDLFHGQQELHKATSLPLRTQETRAAEQVAQAAQQRQQVQAAQQKFLAEPPRRGFPPDWTQREARAAAAATTAQEALQTAQTRRTQMQAAIQGLSKVYHPYDLPTGQAVSAAEVEQGLAKHFEQIEQVVEAAGLSEASRARVRKARRLCPQWVATIAFFHLQVRLWVSQLQLTPALEKLVLEAWIPGRYLEQVARKLPTAEARADVAARAATVLARVRAPEGEWGKLTPAEQARVTAVAQDCAMLFQRASSCVEGRNGQLALRHHSWHRLPRGKLAALTVIHNYYAKRADGTTAAERFFGTKPADLFAWLVDHLDVPARPAAKRAKAAEKVA